MNVCVYDSPATCCREAWQDGRMIAHLSATLMAAKGFDGHTSMPFCLYVGRQFKAGKVYGDPYAMRLTTPGHS